MGRSSTPVSSASKATPAHSRSTRLAGMRRLGDEHQIRSPRPTTAAADRSQADHRLQTLAAHIVETVVAAQREPYRPGGIGHAAATEAQGSHPGAGMRRQGYPEYLAPKLEALILPVGEIHQKAGYQIE